jgi:hypothetical protein
MATPGQEEKIFISKSCEYTRGRLVLATRPAIS